MKKLLLYLSFITFYVAAMEENTFPLQFTDITTVAEQTCGILKKLDEQNWKSYQMGSIMRYLPVDNYNSCRIVDYLCNATRNRLEEEKKRWHVNSFSHLSEIQDNDGRIVNQGIHEVTLQRYLSTRYSLSYLKTQLDDIIYAIQNNWRYFNSKKHSDILLNDKLNKYSYVIFKPYEYIGEHTLIYFLGLEFGLTNEEFGCDIHQIEGRRTRSFVMLWFNIESRAKVINSFNLKIKE